MAFTNFDTKEINCKVVYFGPEGAGKTTNFRSIYNATASEVQSGLLELGSQDDEEYYFKFLPISMGHVKDFHLKIHLFILPKHDFCETVSSVVLKGMDGYVFVTDSQVEKMADNIECMSLTKKLMSDYGYNLSDMPKVIQYNKRDLSNTIPIDILRKEFNPTNFPEQEAIASKALGTMETLQSMAKQVIRRLAV
ncbi:MAG: GTPase domain-containing protein [Bdellovibrionota bacterium]